MAAPPKEGLTFGPAAMREVARAYEAALRIAGEEGGLRVTVPGYDLRQWLAGFILAEARQGPIDADRLTRAALRGLRMTRAAWTLSHDDAMRSAP